MHTYLLKHNVFPTSITRTMGGNLYQDWSIDWLSKRPFIKKSFITHPMMKWDDDIGSVKVLNIKNCARPIHTQMMSHFRRELKMHFNYLIWTRNNIIMFCYGDCLYREHLFPFIAFQCCDINLRFVCNIYIACFVPITLLLTIMAITRRMAKAI